MNVLAIHRPERTDRSPNLSGLLSLFPELRLRRAIVPHWEYSADAVAVRGCSLSHLSCVRDALSATSPVLVFEDDAEAHAPGLDCWNTIGNKIPADAGIIMLGGDMASWGPADANGFSEVLPPFFGSHAVLYLPSLLKVNFLARAYEILASRPIGNDLCYESVLSLALGGTGLKIYRPPVLPFVTSDSFSDREGKAMAGRRVNLDTRPVEEVSAPSKQTPGFIITFCDADLHLVRHALRSIRDVYPQAPVMLIGDGVTQRDGQYDDLHVTFADAGDVLLALGPQLKTAGSGHLWWSRFAGHALSMHTTHVFKFDPDARLHRAFDQPFPASGVFGTLRNKDSEFSHIQGGVQGFARDALHALTSCPPGDYPKPGHLNAPDYFSTDFSCAHVMQAKGLPMTDYADIYSVWNPADLHPQAVRHVAASHPHKTS